MNENTIREQLLTGARDGNFLGAVVKLIQKPNSTQEILSRELVLLHNEKLVDVVDAFSHLTNSKDNFLEFFSPKHLFDDVLPHLEAPVAVVMLSVVQLFKQAGHDLTAGMSVTAYEKFCQVREARPRAAVKMIRDNFEEFGMLLAATVAAGSRWDPPYYLDEILSLLFNADKNIRGQAVFGLGKIHWASQDIPSNVLASLAQFIAMEGEDANLANAVLTAWSLIEADQASLPSVSPLIDAALSRGGEQCMMSAASLFPGHVDLPDSFLRMLLSHFKRESDLGGAIADRLDYGMARLIDAGKIELALEFLEALLPVYGADIFESTYSRIYSEPSLINRIFTRWLLSGELALCEALASIVAFRFEEDQEISVDMSELSYETELHLWFLARKAIGYFFFYPITVASFVISLIEQTNDEELLDAFSSLLFDALLINYLGKTRAYVEKKARQTKGKSTVCIEQALQKTDAYLEALKNVPELVALRLTQKQKDSYRRHRAAEMERSLKEAERKSHLLGIFGRVTLLYGNKSITQIYANPKAAANRVETPLSTHTYSREIPRMMHIDPSALELMLVEFRMEIISS